MSYKFWINIVTVLLLSLVVYLGWGEIVQAWQLMGSVNIWIFLLLIPVQYLSYYSVGQIIVSYLKSTKVDIKMSRFNISRLALELNFVNHILPVSGAAGFSYLGWFLAKHGISSAKSSMAMIVRFVTDFVSFVLIIICCVIALAFDHKINQSITVVSILFILVAIFATFFVIYTISKHKRLVKISNLVSRIINKVVKKISRDKHEKVIDSEKIEKYLDSIHDDYVQIKSDKSVLVKPFLWSTLNNFLDVSLVFISFWALGYSVNPAMLAITFGITSAISFFAVTPGGAGVYEAIMVGFLAMAGLSPKIAIAGTLLARVALLLLTIVFGYIFYQLTIIKYGKIPKSNSL